LFLLVPAFRTGDSAAAGTAFADPAGERPESLGWSEPDVTSPLYHGNARSALRLCEWVFFRKLAHL